MYGTRIKELRKEKGLYQGQLADLLNISVRTIRGYENEEREPSFDILRGMAKIFNCSIDYLLGLTDEVRYQPKYFTLERKEYIIAYDQNKQPAVLDEDDLQYVIDELEKARKNKSPLPNILPGEN